MIATAPCGSERVPTSAEILAGLKTAAKLAKRYGAAYLPYFAHLENELRIAKEREALLDRINALLSD
jgi:hypothetical protein